jgi:hypothetical protein
VLIHPQTRFPIRRTHLVLVDPKTLHLRHLTLRGGFTYDALSPDGTTLFLVQYVSAHDPTRYAVRAYDLGRRRLVPGAIVDRREPDEEMSGSPLTRATSAGGRWSYTLYDGNGKTPFVHALDTTARRAFCIDLPALRGSQQLGELRLRLGSPGLRLVNAGEPIAFVDTKTMKVVDGGTARVRRSHTAPAGGGGGVPWTLLLGGTLAAAAVGAALLAARRRRALVGPMTD